MVAWVRCAGNAPNARRVRAPVRARRLPQNSPQPRSDDDPPRRVQRQPSRSEGACGPLVGRPSPRQWIPRCAKRGLAGRVAEEAGEAGRQWPQTAFHHRPPASIPNRPDAVTLERPGFRAETCGKQESRGVLLTLDRPASKGRILLRAVRAEHEGFDPRVIPLAIGSEHGAPANHRTLAGSIALRATKHREPAVPHPAAGHRRNLPPLTLAPGSR